MESEDFCSTERLRKDALKDTLMVKHRFRARVVEVFTIMLLM